MPTPIIKLSSITNLHDARFGAGMGTLLEMMLGFCVDAGVENAISEQDFAQISAWVTGCKIVLELEGEQISEEAKKILSNSDYKIDYVQVSNLPILVEVDKSDYKFPIIYNYKVADESQIGYPSGIQKELQRDFDIAYFLIESKSEILSNQTFPALQEMAKALPIILGFGITNDNVTELFSQTAIKGVAFKGQAETEVGMGGYQDFDEISDILEQVEELS